jgi:ClpP class serine protease
MNKYLLKRLNTPLMIEYGYLEALLSQEMRITGAKSKGSFAGSIQVIPVYGALSHRSTGLLSWLFGDVMTYESIRRDFQAALTNSEVGSILFDIDSHGGEVAGVFDLADDIYKARGSKPILAIANENALSAAYLIASAADEIYLSRTADVGSIGVTAVHCDYSQM